MVRTTGHSNKIAIDSIKKDARNRHARRVLHPTMTNNPIDTDVFEVNPYEGHPSLTQLESEVLWEYAKLSQHVKIVSFLPNFGTKADF